MCSQKCENGNFWINQDLNGFATFDTENQVQELAASYVRLSEEEVAANSGGQVDYNT